LTTKNKHAAEKARLPSAFVSINFPMWAPKAADGEGASTHEVPTGPTWQQMARNNAATFVVKLDGQGMGVATGAMNDSFNRELWAQPIFVEAFTIKGGMPLICRLASAASDDNLFYKYLSPLRIIPFPLHLMPLFRCFQVFDQLCRSGHVSSFCENGGIRLISRAIAAYRGGATLLRHHALSCAVASASHSQIVKSNWPNSDIASLLIELSMSVCPFSM
jgi:hypothetical protein